MFCKRDSQDPIAQQLYEKDKFLLLGRGFAKGELMAGMIVRRPPAKSGREIVVDTGPALFSNWPKLDVKREPYNRLSRGTSTSSLKASAAAEMAPTFGGTDGVAAAIGAAFERSMVKTLTVSLSGAADWHITEAEFERQCRGLQQTKTALDYSTEGQSFYLVTRAITVSAAVITLENQHAAEALANGNATQLGEVGLKAKLESANAQSVVLQREGQDEVVIAVRCLEILINSDGKVTGLRGPKEMLNIRDGEEFVPTYARLDDLGDENDALFVTITNSRG